MTHPFEVRDEITVDATPDEVWEAIASGPGVDSWLMGRTEIDSASKTSTFNMFGEVSSSSITVWEPGHHYTTSASAAKQDSPIRQRSRSAVTAFVARAAMTRRLASPFTTRCAIAKRLSHWSRRRCTRYSTAWPARSRSSARCRSWPPASSRCVSCSARCTRSCCSPRCAAIAGATTQTEPHDG